MTADLLNLVVNGVTAVATAATAYFTGQQLLGRKPPTIETHIDWYESQPGWIAVVIHVTNHERVALHLTKVEAPHGELIQLATEARLSHLDDPRGDRVPDPGNPEAQKNVFQRIAPMGEEYQPDGTRAIRELRIYVEGDQPPRTLRITWRWIDRMYPHRRRVWPRGRVRSTMWAPRWLSTLRNADD